LDNVDNLDSDRLLTAERHPDKLPARAPPPGLMLFAEDRTGELYALSLGGGVYRLAADA
jgi:hypothetical protein